MSAFEILGGEDYVPFIKDINVKDLGQTVIIDCAGDPELELDYRVICHQCEKVEINFQKEMTSCIGDGGCIDVVEFSTREQPNNRKSVYLYSSVGRLELICESIKLEKDW